MKKTPRPLHARFSVPTILKKSFQSLAFFALAGSVSAATYNPVDTTITGPDSWNAGTNWDTFPLAPTSSIDTALIFSPLSGTFGGPIVNNNTNDLATQPFQLNALTLAGIGSTGATVVNISGGKLDFNTSGTTVAPLISLDATNGTSTVAYNVSSELSLAVTTTITGAGNATFNLTGPISGAGGLTKLGTSTVTLSGAASYAGPTTITAGTVALGASNAIGAGALTVNGGTLAMGANSNSVASVILNGGSITGTGGTLTSAATFDVQNGSISANLAGAVGLTKTGAGTVTLSGTGGYTGLTTVTAGTLTLGASNAIGTGALNVNGGTLAMGANTNSVASVILNGGSITGTGTLTSAATFDVQNGTISANLAGTVGLTKTTGATVTLSGTNLYTGSTAINGGILKISAAANLGDATQASNSISINGGTLNSTANTYDLGANRVITLNGAGTIQTDAGTLTISGAINNGANLLTVNGAGNTTISGVIGNGAGGFTKAGAGTVILSNANTYTGLTTVSAGTLQYGVSNAVADGGVTVTGGTLALGAFNDSVGTVTLTGGSITGTGTLTSTANFDLQNGTVSAILAGATSTVGLTKSTAGTVTLSAANIYAGNTAINGGILKISAANQLGDATQTTNTISFNGGTLNSTANTYDLGANRAITLNGAGTIQTDAGVLTVSGNITNGANLLTVTGAGSTTISGAIGNGAGGLTKTGAGTLILSNANAHLGPTASSAGTLQLANLLAVQSSALSVTGGTLQLRSDTSGTFTSASTTTLGSVTINVDRIGTTATGNTLSLGAFNIGVNTLTVTAGNGYGLGLGVGTQTAAGLTTFTNAATIPITLAGFTSAAGGTSTLSFTGAGTSTITGNITQGAGNVLSLSRITNNGTTFLQGTSNMTGGVSITNSGTIQTAVATNAFGSTTGITINAGTLALRGDSSATFGNGTTAYPVVLGGAATINVNQNATAAANTTLTLGTVSIPGNFTLTTSGANVSLALGAITASAASNKTIANSITAPAGLSIASYAETDASARTFTISGTGKTTLGSLTQNGTNALTFAYTSTGALTLNGTSSNLTGTSTVTAVPVTIASDNPLGVSQLRLIAQTAPFSPTNGATVLQTDGQARTLSSPIIETAGTGGIYWIIGGTGNLTLTGKYTRNGSGTGGVLVNNPLTTFSGGISGANTSGDRTVALRGTGSVIIDTTAISNNPGGRTLIQYGGSATDTPSTNAFNVTLRVLSSYTGTTIINSGKVLVEVDALSGVDGAFGNATTTVTFGAGASAGLDIQLLTGGAVTIGRSINVINDAANSGQNIIGGATDNDSTFSGSIAVGRALKITQVATTGGKKLAFTGGFTGGSGLTFDNAGTVEVRGSIATGTGTVAKSNSGTLLLSGANTYTGATSVTNGALLVGGLQSGGPTEGGAITSAVNVSGTGVFGGGSLATPGSVRAITVDTGGILSPGGTLSDPLSGLGKLALNNNALTFSNTPTLKLEINTSTITSDAITGVSGLVLNSNVALSIFDLGSNVALAPDAVFKFISYATASGITGSGLFTVGGTPIADDSSFVIGANTYYLDYNYNDGTVGVSNVALTLTVVPEPATGVVLLLGTGLLLGRRRRKI